LSTIASTNSCEVSVSQTKKKTLELQ